MRPAIPLAQERSFGRGVGGMLVLLAAYEAWRGRMTLAPVVGAAGLLLLVLSAAAPALLTWPSRAWWALARVLAWINTRLLLTAFFVVVLTPIGLVLRMLGRDPLQRRATGSSWSPFAGRRDPRHYERMF
jgi:hypothetical protein